MSLAEKLKEFDFGKHGIRRRYLVVDRPGQQPGGHPLFEDTDQGKELARAGWEYAGFDAMMYLDGSVGNSGDTVKRIQSRLVVAKPLLTVLQTHPPIHESMTDEQTEVIEKLSSDLYLKSPKLYIRAGNFATRAQSEIGPSAFVALPKRDSQHAYELDAVENRLPDTRVHEVPTATIADPEWNNLTTLYATLHAATLERASSDGYTFSA